MLAAGAGLCDHDAVRVLVEEGPARVQELEKLGAKFDRRDGKPQYLRHMPRIWSYLQRSLDHPSLASLSGWYSVNVPKWTNEQEPRG